MYIKFENLKVDSKRNARTNMVAIDELAESLKRHGQRQSITVYPVEGKEGTYMLDAGYRRVAAAKLLEWDGLEAIVVAPPKNATVTNLVENVAREDLSQYDLACAYKRLKEDGISAQLISKLLSGSADSERRGTSVKSINNLIRLATNLDKRVMRAWSEGHPAATLNNLFDVVKADDQWYAWQVLTGVITPDDDAEESDAEEPSNASDKPKKPRAGMVVKMIAALEAHQSLDPKHREAAIAALRWTLGQEPHVMGVALE